MLSDEEKKAIEQFKNFIFTYQDVIEDEYSDYEEKESAKEYQEVSEKIINLIEKQQKEIEELKDINKKLEARKYMLNARTGEVTAIPIDNNYISKDKIKAKIEEYRKQIEELKDLNIFTYTEYEGAIKFGQSLLEE